MSYYCTLFDTNYLSRGLAMYESLKKQAKNFHLYVLAFDEKCERILKKLSLEHTTVISLEEFENDELKEVKKTRSRGEYCWTCTPSLIKYCIEKYNLPLCTYLDADIYFYDDPEILLEEMGNHSVMISPHNYTPVYDQSETSGIYCVQFVTFRNDERGMMVLDWWRNACNAWCYARVENGKFGDQKYLDDWPERFDGVYVMKHLGGGVAPWNVQQYDFFKYEEGKIYLMQKHTKRIFSLIFYHYHNLRFRNNEKVDLGTYLIPLWARKKLYKEYILCLMSMNTKAQYVENGDYNGVVSLKRDWKKVLLSFLGKINFMKYFLFYFFNWVLGRHLLNVKKKHNKYLMFFFRILIMYHNVYSLDYFMKE